MTCISIAIPIAVSLSADDDSLLKLNMEKYQFMKIKNKMPTLVEGFLRYLVLKENDKVLVVDLVKNISVNAIYMKKLANSDIEEPNNIKAQVDLGYGISKFDYLGFHPCLVQVDGKLAVVHRLAIIKMIVSNHPTKSGDGF